MKKFLIWNNVIDFFILGRIAIDLVLWIDFLKMKSLDTKTISWFYTSDIVAHSSDSKFTHLADANTVF